MTDSPPPAAAPASAPAPALSPKELSSVIIRPWPKVVFLYPIFIGATICWIASAVTTAEGAPYTSVSWMGDGFVLLTFLNLLIFAFDFSRIKSITILFGIIATVFGLFWLNSTMDVFGSLGKYVQSINIQMNTWFYGVFSLMMGAILLLVLINTRFSYYEINHREILHHHGYLGDVTRIPTAGLRLNKEIYDIMEFVLLRSGRLIFYPQSSPDAIVIDNVLNVNHAEDRIKDLLSVMAVRNIEGNR